jgi:hypothetical protein
MSAKIVGSGWSVFVDDRSLVWDLEGPSEQGLTALQMLSGHFPDIKKHLDSTTIAGREYGDLYPMAADFLNTWGIKCKVEGLGPIQFEAPPPPPAD